MHLNLYSIDVTIKAQRIVNGMMEELQTINTKTLLTMPNKLSLYICSYLEVQSRNHVSSKSKYPNCVPEKFNSKNFRFLLTFVHNVID